MILISSSFFFDEGKWNLRNAARLSQILGKRLPRSKSSQSYQDVRHWKRTPPCLKWTECADGCLKNNNVTEKKGDKLEQEGTLRLKIRQLSRKFKRKFSFQQEVSRRKWPLRTIVRCSFVCLKRIFCPVRLHQGLHLWSDADPATFRNTHNSILPLA